MRRRSLGIVDSISQDDTGDLADETVAEALIRLPGVNDMQTLYGEQTAKYISVRGISPDLNFVSFDGIGMFSASNDGAGSRRVDLALIPTQVARTTQVYKTFTPDIDGGVIGGATNIVPYSALEGKEIYYLNARAEYRPSSSDVSGRNSLGKYIDTPWGGAIKGLYVGKFGQDEQFGIVASGIYNQESWTLRSPTSMPGSFVLQPVRWPRPTFRIGTAMPRFPTAYVRSTTQSSASSSEATLALSISQPTI